MTSEPRTLEQHGKRRTRTSTFDGEDDAVLSDLQEQRQKLLMIQDQQDVETNGSELYRTVMEPLASASIRPQ